MKIDYSKLVFLPTKEFDLQLLAGKQMLKFYINSAFGGLQLDKIEIQVKEIASSGDCFISLVTPSPSDDELFRPQDENTIPNTATKVKADNNDFIMIPPILGSMLKSELENGTKDINYIWSLITLYRIIA